MNAPTVADRESALIKAYDAIAHAATAGFRMAGNVRPFSPSRERFNHIYRAGDESHLSLCLGMAAARTHKLLPLYLPHVDCLVCLDRYTRIIAEAFQCSGR